MGPLAEKLLRTLVGTLARDPKARPYAPLASVILEADGLPPEPTELPVSAGALRQRNYRERHLLRHGDASRDGITVTRNAGGLGGDLLNSREEKDLTKHPLPEGDPGESDASPLRVTVTPSVTGNDFGMSVSAWAEGIHLETGETCLEPFGMARRRLLDTLEAYSPAAGDRVAWARESAREFARTCKGRTLNAFTYGDWLQSGKPSVRRAGTVEGPADPADPYHTPEARKERAAAAKRERAAAGLPPAGLVSGLVEALGGHVVEPKKGNGTT